MRKLKALLIIFVLLSVTLQVAGKERKAYKETRHQAQLEKLYRAQLFTDNLQDYKMPTPSRKVTSRFGARWGRKHKGLDIKVQTGDTIRSTFAGTVRVTQYNRGGYGYYVVIDHGKGLQTLYGHLSKYIVKPGMKVKAGEPIGLGGNTGHSTGSHLHFETIVNGESIDPTLIFDFTNQRLCYEHHRDAQLPDSATYYSTRRISNWVVFGADAKIKEMSGNFADGKNYSIHSHSNQNDLPAPLRGEATYQLTTSSVPQNREHHHELEEPLDVHRLIKQPPKIVPLTGWTVIDTG